MAQVMSEALGTPVRFQQIPLEAFKARLMQRGMSEAMAQGNLDMWVAYGQGLDTAEPRTPQSTTPTTFRPMVCGGAQASRPGLNTTESQAVRDRHGKRAQMSDVTAAQAPDLSGEQIDRILQAMAESFVGLPVDAGGARRYVVIGLLAAGLGLQNATVRPAASHCTATCHRSQQTTDTKVRAPG
jgi:hypothetical protein